MSNPQNDKTVEGRCLRCDQDQEVLFNIPVHVSELKVGQKFKVVCPDCGLEFTARVVIGLYSKLCIQDDKDTGGYEW